MLEVKGDFSKIIQNFDAIVSLNNKTVLRNGKLSMSGGLARWFKDTFQYIDQIWGQEILASNANVIFTEWKDSLYNGYLVAFPTKYDVMLDADIGLVEICLKELVKEVDKRGIKTVLLGRPGAGLGNLRWTDVKPLCQKYLDDRFTIICYEYEND